MPEMPPIFSISLLLLPQCLLFFDHTPGVHVFMHKWECREENDLTWRKDRSP